MMAYASKQDAKARQNKSDAAMAEGGFYKPK
jgi:hypothetical protein